MEAEIKKFKIELQKIIDSLEWFYIEKCKCPNCGNELFFKVSVLDEDKGVICPKCKKNTILGGDFFPKNCETYQYLFLDAMRESLRRVVDATYDFRSCYVRAYTSFEIFLYKVTVSQFKKKNVDGEIISFILDEVRPKIEFYFKLFKKLNVVLDKKDEKDIELRRIQNVRNGIVHKGFFISEEQILKAFEKISRIFRILTII